MIADKIEGLDCGVPTFEARDGLCGPAHNSSTFVLATMALLDPKVALRPVFHLEAGERGPWIASSQGLLAMTVNGGVRVPRVDFLISGLCLRG
jgi:hypothetical protein